MMVERIQYSPELPCVSPLRVSRSEKPPTQSQTALPLIKGTVCYSESLKL